MLALLATLAIAGSSAQDPPMLLLGKAMVAVSSLSEDLGEKERSQAMHWIDWGRSLGYEAILDESRRVLLLNPIKRKAGGRTPAATGKPPRRSRAEQSALSKKLELIDATLKSADACFPMPSEKTRTEAEHETWTGEAERESLPVLIELRGAADLRELLAHIEKSHPYLEQWAKTATEYSGFTLFRPLVGAWVAEGSGLEEWSPHNELVNRLTRLLLVERYGSTPRWLDLDLAWQAEMSIMESIYCFPERSGFVSVQEHQDWDRMLRRLHKKREGAFSLSEVASTPSKEFNLDTAHRSWGVAEFLVQRYPEAISPFLLDLAQDRLVRGRIDKPDGTWELIAGYEASASTQEALLRKHIGEGALKELSEFLKNGAK